jgi:hypothetical protein
MGKGVRNICFAAVRNGRVCGMTAVHDQLPFSVAAALDAPSLPHRSRRGRRLAEVGRVSSRG